MLPLKADGLDLRLTDGSPFVWRGSLMWPLLGKHLNEGDSVSRSLLKDRKAVGANIVCCAGMLTWGSPFDPSHPLFWDDKKGIRRLADVAAEEQMRVCFVVFCDTRSLMPDQNAQLAHWERFYTTLGDKPNVVLVLMNQPGHPSQNIDPMIFNPPPSIAGFPKLLASRDNPMEDGPPSLPPWSLSLFCSKRNEPHWYMEAGCVSMWTIVNDFSHGPTVLFEPPPCGRQPRWTDPNKWRQFARSLCFRGTVGGNFYSDQDARCEVYTDVTRTCAVEFLGNIPNP